MNDIHINDDATTQAMLDELKRNRRIKVRSGKLVFWILSRNWEGVVFGYGPSLDGKTPEEPLEIMDSKIWNWLAHLERA